jgi:DNA-binding transcriptional regulator YbjK
MALADRRQHILEAAARVAKRYGLPYVTHGRVAEECYWPTSATTVWRVIGDTEKLMRATQDMVAASGSLTKTK